MSYTKEISYRDYEIKFEYDYDPGIQMLNLLNWTAYEGVNEIAIPCRVESHFIEKQLDKWIDNEWKERGNKYVEDYLDYLAEQRYNILDEV